jgi:WD40 repeat protein
MSRIDPEGGRKRQELRGEKRLDTCRAHRPRQLGASSVHTSPRRPRTTQVQAASSRDANEGLLVRKRRNAIGDYLSYGENISTLSQRIVAVRFLEVLDGEGLETLRRTVFGDATDDSGDHSVGYRRAKFLHAAARLVTSANSSKVLPSNHELLQLVLQLGEIWNKAEVLRVKHAMTSNHKPGVPVDAGSVEVRWEDLLSQVARDNESEENEASSSKGSCMTTARSYSPQVHKVLPGAFKVDMVYNIANIGKNGVFAFTEMETHTLYLYTVSYVEGAERVLSLARAHALDDHRSRITCVLYLEVQMLLLACTLDQRLCFWDLSDLASETEDARRLGGVNVAKKAIAPETIHSAEYVEKIGPASNGMKHIVLLGGESGDVHMFDITLMKVMKSGRFSDGPDKVHKIGPVSGLCSISHLRLAASGGGDGQLILWDLSVAVPKRKRVLKGHTKPITSITFSEQHQFLVSVGFDKEIFIWNTYMEIAVSRLSGHISPIIHAVVAEYAAEILSVSNDGVLKVWDLQGLVCKQTLRMFKLDDDQTTSGFILLDTPDVAHALSVASSGVRVYSTIDATVAPGVTGKDLTMSVLYHELEGWFVTASGRQIRIWNANTGKLLRTFEIDDDDNDIVVATTMAPSGSFMLPLQRQPLAITCMAFDRHQKQLITGDIRGRVTARLLYGGSPIRHLQSHTSEILSIVCIERLPGNLVSCSTNGEVRVHQVHNHTVHATVLTLMHPNPRVSPMRMPERACGPSIAMSKARHAPHRRRKVVTFGDFVEGAGEAQKEGRDPSGPTGHHCVILTAFSVPAGLLATVGSDNSICIWDMKLTSKPGSQPLGVCHDTIDGQVVSCVCFAGSFPVLISCNMSGRISIWTTPPHHEPYQLVDNFLNMTQLSEKQSIVAPLQLCFDEENGYLLSGDVSGWLTVWDLSRHLKAYGIERTRASLLYFDSLNDVADDSTTEEDESDSGSTRSYHDSGLSPGEAGNDAIATFLTQTKDQRNANQTRGMRATIKRVRSWWAHEYAVSFLNLMQTPSIRMNRHVKGLSRRRASNINGVSIVISGSFNRCISLWNMDGDLIGKLSEKYLRVPVELRTPENPMIANASVEGPNNYSWKLRHNPLEINVKADRFKEAQRVVSELRNTSLESLQHKTRCFESEKGSSTIVVGKFS